MRKTSFPYVLTATNFSLLFRSRIHFQAVSVWVQPVAKREPSQCNKEKEENFVQGNFLNNILSMAQHEKLYHTSFNPLMPKYV
jgi:hypothetical protein